MATQRILDFTPSPWLLRRLTWMVALFLTFLPALPMTPTVMAGQTATTSTAGALQFDGSNDYVIAALDGTTLTQFTIEMWVKRQSNFSGQRGIFQWANGLNNTNPFVLFADTGTDFRWYVNDSYPAVTSLTTGQWTHFAVTFASNTYKFYKNGTLYATYTGGFGSQSRAQSVYFGNGYNGYWNGQLDNVSIWNVERSQTQIQTSMNTSLAAIETGLLAYYSFDDGTGSSTAANSVSGGPNGTLTNMNVNSAWVTGVVGTNADLNNLTLSNGTLSPVFASNTTSYNATANVSSITVTPTASDGNATIQVRVNGGSYSTVTSGSPSDSLALNLGTNTIDVKVTAQDGTTTKTYTVTVNRITVPEIDVQGNSVSIASGDTSPSTNDHTDFGSVNVSSGTVVRTFTIQNSGNAALTLNGTSPVSVSGTNASDFTVTQPAVSSVAAGASTTFQITFDPSAAGIRTATVTIANNDSDEGSYTFAIKGTGAQALSASQLTQLSGYSQTCATVTTPYVKQCTINFTLQNISGGVLQVKYYQLTTLSSHVDLLNGTPNPGGVGAQVTGPGSVAASATFPASFTLGLKSNTAYTIRYKVYGYAGAVLAAGADDTQAIELGEYAVTLPAEDVISSRVFLPLVVQ